MNYSREELQTLFELEKDYGDELKLNSIFGIKSSDYLKSEVILGFGTNSIIEDGYYVGINLDLNKEINKSDKRIFFGPYPLDEGKKQYKLWCENIVNLALMEF